MKTAGRENQNPWAVPKSRAHGAEGQNRSCSNKWAAKQLQRCPSLGTIPRDPQARCESGSFSFESERIQFIAGGTWCFTSSSQFSTALICRKVAASSLLIIKNRRPSGETSNADSWLSPL